MTQPTAKPLAKSLHTVTVLTRLAIHLRKSECVDCTQAVTDAAFILGLGDMPDTYGLRAAAARLVAREEA